MTATRLNIAITEDGLSFPATGRILVLRAVSSFDYAGLPTEDLHLVNSFRPEYDRLTRQGYSVTAQPDGSYAATLVHITRSKQETLGLIAQAFQLTLPGGVIVVDGAKTDGIESALKQCKSLFDISGLTVKAHGKLFWINRPDALPDQINDWIAALAPKPNRDGFLTAPGMFSMDRVDFGSAMLAAAFRCPPERSCC